MAGEAELALVHAPRVAGGGGQGMSGVLLPQQFEISGAGVSMNSVLYRLFSGSLKASQMVALRLLLFSAIFY